MKKLFKNIFAVIFNIVLTTVLLSIATYRVDAGVYDEYSTYAGNVTVDEIYFPDENFRQYVLENCDSNGDYVLSQSEIDAVTQINCRDEKIKSLDGIECFTSLEYLDCSWNDISELDVSALTGLKILYCYDNDITELNLGKLVNLTELFCAENELTQLDLSGLTNLTDLFCSENNLSELNLSGLSCLTSLNCWGNELTVLDVEKLTNLSVLDCSNNNISSLKLTKLVNLTKLDCSYNNISSLDLNNLSKLFYLDCSYNNISSINTDMLDNLVYFYNKGNLCAEKIDIALCSVQLNSEQYTYNGIAKMPLVTVKYESKALVNGTDYSVKYTNNNAIGTATATIIGKGEYKGKVTKNFTIKPTTPSLTSATNVTAGVTVKWGKVAGAAGYYVYRKSGNGSWVRITEIKSGSTVSYTDKTAKSGTAYTYTVRAYSGKYVSGYNSTGKTCKRLSNPSITSASNVSSGIIVKWGKVTGASGYYVYRKSGSGNWSRIAEIKNGSTVSYNDTKAANGTTYTYTVRAYSGSYISSYNAAGKTYKRLANPVISSVNNGASGVNVKWSKVTGATGYYVYRKSGSESWTRIAEIKSGSTVSYTDTKAVNGTTYTYTLRAKNGSYVSYYNSGKSVMRLTSPSISSVTNQTAGKITVKWNQNIKATGYQIYYKTGSTVKILTISGNKNVSKVISQLSKGKTYTVYVRSYKKVGDKNYYSAWSAAKTIKISK